MKQSWPDLDAVEAFLVVADAGSFTAAARRLGRSKVVLSRRVTDLEQQLGERLLNRTTRHVGLTDAGAGVRDRASALLDQARGLVDAVSAASRDVGGRLRIVASQLLYELLLERVVVPFVERHPRIELVLDVVADPAKEVRAGYDVAIVVGPAPDSAMGSLLLGRAKIGCYASERYTARFGAPASPADLARHAIATAATPRPLRWTFSRAGRSETITIAPRLSLGSHDLVLRAALAGIAIARLPHFYVRHSGRRDALRPLLAEWSCPPVAAYAIFPNRERPSPAARTFLAELREPLKSAAP